MILCIFSCFQAIVEFIKQLGWEYVTVVHTDNDYGKGAYRAIRPYLAEAGICLTAAFPANPNDDSDNTIDGLLDSVMATNTTGVIYLGNNMLIEAFLRRGEVKDNAGLLQWVVTDSVSLADTFPGQKYPRGRRIYYVKFVIFSSSVSKKKSKKKKLL